MGKRLNLFKLARSINIIFSFICFIIEYMQHKTNENSSYEYLICGLLILVITYIISTNVKKVEENYRMNCDKSQ